MVYVIKRIDIICQAHIFSCTHIIHIKMPCQQTNDRGDNLLRAIAISRI